MWFIGVEVEQETSAPPPKKNPGSAPAVWSDLSKQATVPSSEVNILVSWFIYTYSVSEGATENSPFLHAGHLPAVEQELPFTKYTQ